MQGGARKKSERIIKDSDVLGMQTVEDRQRLSEIPRMPTEMDQWRAMTRGAAMMYTADNGDRLSFPLALRINRAPASHRLTATAEQIAWAEVRFGITHQGDLRRRLASSANAFRCGSSLI